MKTRSKCPESIFSPYSTRTKGDMAHTISSSVHWAVLASLLILGPKLPGWRFYSEKRVLCDLVILTLVHGTCHILTQTEDRDHQAAHTLRMGRLYSFWKLSPALLSEEWKSQPPHYLLRPHKMTTFWALRANPDRPRSICLCEYRPG